MPIELGRGFKPPVKKSPPTPLPEEPTMSEPVPSAPDSSLQETMLEILTVLKDIQSLLSSQRGGEIQ